MKNLNFTKTALRQIAPPEAGKRLTVYDTGTRKLAMRITATGTRTFYVVKRVGASMTWVKLGTFPSMTVEQARGEAQKILGEFATGANPAAARRAIREEPTFAGMLGDFLTNKRKRDGSPLGEKTKRDYQDTLRLYLDPIRSKKLSHITRADVKAIHKKTTKKSAAQADRAIAIISAVFAFAIDHEHFGGVNPASRIQKNAAPSRDRFAQADELPYLLAAIAESNLRDYFLLSLLTGARRSNVQSMTWRDIDMDGAIWRIGMTKNGTPQNVPLSPEAITVLKDRKQSAASPFVFPGIGKTGHLVEPKKSWAVILKRASIRRGLDQLQAMGALTDAERQDAETRLRESPAKMAREYQARARAAKLDPSAYDMTDLRVHDLRRTLGSWQAKTGASLAIIGKSLNHKTYQATAIYARLDLDPVRQSINTATKAMFEAAGLNESAAVVALPHRRTIPK